MQIKSIYIIILLTISIDAFGYIGPGVGGGILVAVFGLILAILLSLVGIIYYPIKRVLKRRKIIKK